jgi:TP901 family phage tail tape measure protein
MAEEIQYKIVVTENQLLTALNKTKEELNGVSKKVDDAGKSFDKLGTNLSSIKNILIGNLGADLVTAAFGKLKGEFSEAIDEARKFSRAVAEINSTLPNNVKLTEAQTKALKALGVEYGSSATAQAKAFYEVVSGGIEDTATAFTILRNSNEAAIGGLVATNQAAQLITSTFNAYAKQGTTVQQITDTLASAAQLSAVKFEELSQTMGRVTNIAAQSGVSIGELVGSIAALRNVGLTTEQAVTGLAGILNELGKPSKDVAQAAKQLGIDFSLAAIKSKGFVQFMQEVTVAAKGNTDILSKLFGDQRARNAAIAIASSNFEKYAETVDKATNSLGAAKKAADEVKSSFDFKIEQKEAAFKALSLTLGEALAPALTVAAEATTSLIKQLTGIGRAPSDSIEGINQQIEKTSRIIELIRAKKFDAAEALLGGNVDFALMSASKINVLLQDQIKLRSQLEKQVQSKQEAQVEKVAGAPVKDTRLEQEVLVDQQILDARKNLIFEIANLEATQRANDLIVKQESLIAEVEADKLAKEEALLRAQELNTQIINEQFAAEEAKNKVIADAEQRRLATKKTNLAKDLALTKVNAKSIEEINKAQIQADIVALNRKAEVVAATAQLGTALTKDGSKAQFLINKAAAVAQILIARATGIANALMLPPPAQPAAIAHANTVAGISLATVAATALKGFADGGFIGGNVGASSGSDNTLFRGREGELVLTANDQKMLLDGIRGGKMGGGDIIVNIDGREVFRAMRDQVRSGAVLA